MKSYCQTDAGRVRAMNQDFVYASDEPVGQLPNLYIVADGMGGHNAGDYASRCCVETMVDYIENHSEKRTVRLLEKAIESANEAIYIKALSDKSYSGMGTTVVAACVVDECLYLANVGDSRLYLLTDHLRQITKDHSLVEEMIRNGQITRSEARNHPDKNVITRAVGTGATLRADLFDVPMTKDDILLICSDGLTNMLTDREITRILRGHQDLPDAGDILIRTANESGGTDNISVVLAAFSDSDRKDA